VGTNAVRLREDGGNTEQNFATIAGGGLDLAAIATFKGANNLFVVTLYDQVGSAHLTNATADQQPLFTLAGLGSLPIMSTADMVSGNEQLQTSAAFALSAPYSWIVVAMNEVGASGSTWQQSLTLPIQFGANTSPANSWGTTAIGSETGVAAAEDVWHTAANTQVTGGGASKTYVDAVGASGIPSGGGAAMSGAFRMGSLRGHVVELGIYPFQISDGNATALDANQSTYWGF
jgi:hypothetical protein